MRRELETLIKENKLVVFMKGDPSAPRCGFSRAVCAILDLHGVKKEKMLTVDVLSNPMVREQIKLISQWPTIPQVFVDGEFVGGCDLMVEMNRTGQLHELLQKHQLVD